MKKIIVVGGGAAGLMAAYSAAMHGAEVTLLEKMPAIGRKILITGKGRCNITNSCDITEFIKNMSGNGKFLYASFRSFTNEDIRNFLHKLGVPTKIERGGRVFPVSDKAADVVNAFNTALKNLNVTIITQK
jgi:predicted Rossmann fold flavoprotein